MRSERAGGDLDLDLLRALRLRGGLERASGDLDLDLLILVPRGGLGLRPRPKWAGELLT